MKLGGGKLMDQNRLIHFHNIFTIIFTLTAFLLSLYRCENELFGYVSCFHFIFSTRVLAIFCCNRGGIAIFIGNIRNDWEWVRNTVKFIFMIQLLTQFQHLFYSSTPLSESFDCAYAACEGSRRVARSPFERTLHHYRLCIWKQI